MADTAHAEVYRRPAFHNYGRSSSVIPGVSAFFVSIISF